MSIVSGEELMRMLCLFSVYTQAIILNSSTSLLEPYFLPVSQRLKAKCEDLYNQEQSLKHATRLESSEREDLESTVMKVGKQINWKEYPIPLLELRNSRS